MRKEFQDNPEISITNLTNLRALLEGVDTIYVYPHHEVKLEEGAILQTRSGPNWEGGVVTITTCKHLLRTYKSMVEGKTALIGLTNKLEGENFLMYAGVIDLKFPSNYHLGDYLVKNNPTAYTKKLAKNNRLGDIFEASSRLFSEDIYDFISYDNPCNDHCRFEENDSKGDPKWWKDIEYVTSNGTRPSCLILDPVTVHTTPVYYWTGRLGRSGVVFKGDNCIEDMMSNIEEVL